VYEVVEFKLDKELNEQTIEIKQEIPIDSSGKLNGAVIWHEIDYGNNNLIQTGILNEPLEGNQLKWSDQYKQAIHIFDKEYDSYQKKVQYEIKFNLNEGFFDLKFKVF
jgi:uncharacterized FlaG/YvyC family protein